jgi:TonB-dependent starch-binding outer membrane protein SusC
MRRIRFIFSALLAVLWVAPLSAQAPTGSVRGRVTDGATQQPLAGVTVSVAGHNALTATDGRYFITSVPAGASSVQARLLGYAPATNAVTVVAGQTAEVNLTMSAQAVGLSEMVVVGYGEQRAGDITGAVSQLSSDEFNGGRIVTPAELIQGKVPGVEVVDNNEPGGGLSIRIRGTTSAQGSNEPLYVIDGMPVGNYSGGGISSGRDPLNSINPDDIESITVLRDASAAAIYGTNATNGVVIITTKRGTRPQVEYTGSTSASQVTRLPDMLNAQQFATAVQTYAPANAGQLLTNNTDWFSQIDRTAYGQDHNIAVSGSDANTNWRLSGGYLDQDGILDGSTVQRLSLGSSLQQRIFGDRLNVQVSARGSREHDLFTPGGVLSNAAQMGPTQPIVDSTTGTGYYNWPDTLLQSADNPVEILRLGTDQGTTYRAIGNMQASYRLPWVGDAFTAHMNLGFDVAKADRAQFNPSSLHAQEKTGTFGSDYHWNNSAANSVFEAYLTYAAPLHFAPGNIDITGGYSYSQSHSDFTSYSGTGLSTDLLGGNGVTSALTVQNQRFINEDRLISFFGRANWNYNDRYLASVSLRHDGSSRFAFDHQWANFPSVSVGWRLSQESFMPHFLGLSDLKLRGSWARTGNQPTSFYLAWPTFTAGDAQSAVEFGANNFVSTVRAGNYTPNITWEETNAYNAGLDFGFSNQRYSGTIDWYTRSTNNLIFTVACPAGSCLSDKITKNVGSMRNSGVELGLNARILEGRGRRFSWTAAFTVTHNHNEMQSIDAAAGVTQLLVGGIAGGVGNFIQVLQPGYAVNTFYVYQHRRDANGRPIYADNNGLDANGKFTGTPDGTINEQDLYVDQNGDSIINFNDRRQLHDPAPKWIIGHTSYLGWGSWSLDFTLRAYLGNYVYNNVASNLGTYQELRRGSPYNLHASVLETNFNSPQYFSDYYVEDASFLRLDNLTLAYSFNYHSTPLRLFVSGKNLFTITGYSGVDPTAGLNGIDNNIYPRSRTWTAGLTVRL